MASGNLALFGSHTTSFWLTAPSLVPRRRPCPSCQVVVARSFPIQSDELLSRCCYCCCGPRLDVPCGCALAVWNWIRQLSLLSIPHTHIESQPSAGSSVCCMYVHPWPVLCHVAEPANIDYCHVCYRRVTRPYPPLFFFFFSLAFAFAYLVSTSSCFPGSHAWPFEEWIDGGTVFSCRSATRSSPQVFSSFFLMVMTLVED